MIARVLEKYRTGKLTTGHAAVELLRMVDPSRPELVLQGLPADIVVRIHEFTKEYRAGEVITNYGTVPGEEQVVAAKSWIEANLEVPR